MATPQVSDRPPTPPAHGPRVQAPQAEMPRPTMPGAPMGQLPGGMWGSESPQGYAPRTDQPSVTVASFRDYADTQRAVDYLSDQGFPVQNTSIVGTDLRTVEQVLGRITTGRAALSGAAGGAWLGLFIGLLLGLFAVGTWLGVVLTAIVIGAVWGAIFGAVAHAMTRGQRDFSSRSQLQASEYAVKVQAPYADQAREILGRLNPIGSPTR